jgi:hypothetical protein
MSQSHRAIDVSFALGSAPARRSFGIVAQRPSLLSRIGFGRTRISKGSAQNFQSRVKPPDSQSGQPGDFLVQNFQDRETAYPADVWIVDQTRFRQTYESVAPGK